MFLDGLQFTGASYLPFGGDRRIPADALKLFVTSQSPYLNFKIL